MRKVNMQPIEETCVLLITNACAQKFKLVQDILETETVVQLHHQSYSPDLSPCDHFPFYFIETQSLKTSLLVPKCSWQVHFQCLHGVSQKVSLSAFRAWTIISTTLLIFQILWQIFLTILILLDILFKIFLYAYWHSFKQLENAFKRNYLDACLGTISPKGINSEVLF